MELEWKEPPPHVRKAGGRLGMRAAFVLALKERPGEWALYPKPVTSSACRGLEISYPGVETTRRTRGEGDRWDVYARWIGES